MNAITPSEQINRRRRRFVGAGATSIAAACLGSLLLRANLAMAAEGDAIHPFRVNIPEDQLVDLRRRIAATRWPDRETVADQSQGAQLAKFQELVRLLGYGLRLAEGRGQAQCPPSMTTIDGVDIHFIHVRSRHPNALPIIITHGWPGSVIEQLKIIDPLSNPTAHGGSANDAFDVVIPSLPGYGFSGRPTGTGWDPDRIARAWTKLMKRLGYTRSVAQGGDWARRSRVRWRARLRQDCAAFISICQPRCRLRWLQCSLADPHQQDSLTKNARCSKHSERMQ
jgi:hypothetical protein